MTDLVELARRIESLEQEHARIREALGSAEQARDRYHELYLDMMERCRKLERGLLGQKAERLPAEGSQLSLQMLQLLLSDRALREIDDLEVEHVRGHERRKPTGRKPLPEHLPRIDIEVLPDEVQHEGLDAFERIGEEVTEILERRPASLVVARIIKPKFVRKDRERGGATQILVGSTPALPIERGLAGPGMLADSIVKRWQDHLPLNRLEGIYARDGVELARSTVCGWHEQLVPLAEPLVGAMRRDAFEQPFLCTDATGVLVQAKDKCRTGHFFVLVAPRRHVLFEYTRRHDSDAVDNVLAGYEGYLVADAHVVYDHLYADGRVTEVNCWAHYPESIVIWSGAGKARPLSSARATSREITKARSISLRVRRIDHVGRSPMVARHRTLARERAHAGHGGAVFLLGQALRSPLQHRGPSPAGVPLPGSRGEILGLRDSDRAAQTCGTSRRCTRGHARGSRALVCACRSRIPAPAMA